jgi:hypothetical protein
MLGYVLSFTQRCRGRQFPISWLKGDEHGQDGETFHARHRGRTVLSHDAVAAKCDTLRHPREKRGADSGRKDEMAIMPRAGFG